MIRVEVRLPHTDKTGGRGKVIDYAQALLKGNKSMILKKNFVKTAQRWVTFSYDRWILAERRDILFGNK